MTFATLLQSLRGLAQGVRRWIGSSVALVPGLAPDFLIEFVVIGTPLSQQASTNRKNIWKALVASRAAAASSFGLIGPLNVTVVYFCVALGVDIDNILKPILDAMKGVLYEDDRQVFRVESIAIELQDASRLRNVTTAIATGLATA